jgi:hypothetical protein
LGRGVGKIAAIAHPYQLIDKPVTIVWTGREAVVEWGTSQERQVTRFGTGKTRFDIRSDPGDIG